MGDVTCNRTTGRCDTGCKAGYTGELCDAGLITRRFKNSQGKLHVPRINICV